MADDDLKTIRETTSMLNDMNHREVKRQWKRHQLREVREDKIAALPPFQRALAQAWIDITDTPFVPALLVFISGVAVGVAITLLVLK